MGALAEFERALIVERTRAGMVAARMRGTHVGRQPKLTDRQIITALRLTGPGNRTLDEVAGKYGVERSTLFKAMKRFKKSWKE